MNSDAPGGSRPRQDLARLRIDRSSETVETRRSGALPWSILFLLIAYVVFDQLGSSALNPSVEVGRVTQTGGVQASSGVSANGYVVARRRAALSTDVLGRLVDLRVEEGQRVVEKELIAKLDTKQLEAARVRAKADVLREVANRRLAALSRDRFQRLVDNGHEPVAGLDSAKAEFDRADASVQVAQAAVREIEVQIENSSIFAPFDGVIILKNAEIGEVVAATGSGGNNSRGAVATLVDFDTLEIQVELSQTSLRAATEGASASVYLDAFPDDALKGKVRQIWPTADRQTATVELRIELDEPSERLRPDLGCRVVFEEPGGDPSPRQIWVSSRALVETQSDDPSSSIFVVIDGVVVLKSIELGEAERGDRREVAKGLRGNELVVLDPPTTLEDGDRVQVSE